MKSARVLDAGVDGNWTGGARKMDGEEGTDFGRVAAAVWLKRAARRSLVARACRWARVKALQGPL